MSEPKAAVDIKYLWGEGVMAFDCPCGCHEMIVSDQTSEFKDCDCGRKYRLVHYVEYKED